MILTPTITPLGAGVFRIAWMGTAGRTVRVFVNGLLAFGPTVVSSSAKSIDLPLPDPSIVEVHENLSTETVGTSVIALERKPIVWWSSVPGAALYRVYFDDVVVATVTHESWRLHHQVTLAVDVRQDGETWTNFRVEAVDEFGIETTTSADSHFAPGAPTAPSAVAITGGSGSFDIEVTL